MPFAAHDGVRIHFDVAGDGPALVLHHGFSQRLDHWQMLGYHDALITGRRLIAIDGRGHGQSDKPREPSSYDLSLRTKDVVAVLDALQIDRADYLGYSMGGWIGYGLARDAPHRLRSLLIGGAHPFADDTWQNAFSGLDGSSPDAFVTALESVVSERIPPLARSFIVANDLPALIASATDRPSLEGAISPLTIPCLFYCGDRDARHDLVTAAARRAQHGTFVSLPNLGHLAAFTDARASLPHIQRFLETVAG